MKNFRIKYCKEAERNVLQLQCIDDNEWICLHCDTLEEEQQDMLSFLENNPDATLQGNPGILIRDLELVQGHLINSEMGIDICLWPTQPGDKPDPVLITPHYSCLTQQEKKMLNDSTIYDQEKSKIIHILSYPEKGTRLKQE